jgi:radical SAM protein with 4Fe4S-binding SPASM domain
MVRMNEYSFPHIPLYLYLAATYARFLAAGRCLGMPIRLVIQTQSFCNARCAICPYATVSQRLDQGAMEWDLFARIVDEAASAQLVRTVRFDLQSEPLLNKEILGWVKHVKSASPGKYCIISTNGELLDRFNLADIRESGLDLLAISLSAHSREVYEAVNCGLDYDRVMRNVSRVLSDPQLKQRTRLNFVVTEENMHDVDRAVEYWDSRGVRTLVSRLQNRAGSLDSYDRLRLRRDAPAGRVPPRIRRGFRPSPRNAAGCALPFYQMPVLFNGDVLLCCHDWNRAVVVGNARHSSLREIWNSARMNEIRRLLLRRLYERIDSCRECSLVR